MHIKCFYKKIVENCQWRIQDFPVGNSKGGSVNLLFGQFFCENCMKFKEIALGAPLRCANKSGFKCDSNLWSEQWSVKRLGASVVDPET